MGRFSPVQLFPSTLRRMLRAAKWGSIPPRDPVVAAFLGYGTESAAGVVVTPDTAQQVAAVYACVRVIAETLASLPLHVYRRLPRDGRERDPAHSLYDVLHRRPNRWQTTFEFVEMMQGHLELRGNGYARIVAGAGAAVRELVPLHPDRVQPFWADDDRTLPAYEYHPPGGPMEIILQQEMFHLRGPGDGLKGASPIELHRETIGETMAAQRYNARLMKNDGRPVGVLEHPGNFKDDGDRREFLKSFHDAHSGDNRGRIALLERGIKYHELGLKGREMEFLGQRKYSRSEIAGIFRVPAHKIGDLERSTNNNIEQQSLDFYTDTILPRAVRWEQAIDRDLFTAASRRTHFAAFLMEGILRADSAARAELYQALFQTGAMTPNDILQRENMNPYEGGDRHFAPVNMVPVDLLDELFRRRLAEGSLPS